MPSRSTKLSSQPTNATKQSGTPGQKRSTTSATDSTTSSGAKRQKTSQEKDPRPLTTEDLPTLIKEVCNNLRQNREEADCSDELHDGQRRTTRQTRQRDGTEQNPLSGRKDQGCSQNEATTRRGTTTTQDSTSRRNIWTHEADNEDQTADGELNLMLLKHAY